MKALVEADCYDVLGHIIYPLRYMCLRDGQNVDLSRYMEVIRTLLRRAVERGRGMELNTWAGRTIEPWRSVLQAYRDCGGELITVGSDAHVASSIGSGIRWVKAVKPPKMFEPVRHAISIAVCRKCR